MQRDCRTPKPELARKYECTGELTTHGLKLVRQPPQSRIYVRQSSIGIRKRVRVTNFYPVTSRLECL